MIDRRNGDAPFFRRNLFACRQLCLVDRHTRPSSAHSSSNFAHSFAQLVPENVRLAGASTQNTHGGGQWRTTSGGGKAPPARLQDSIAVPTEGADAMQSARRRRRRALSPRSRPPTAGPARPGDTLPECPATPPPPFTRPTLWQQHASRTVS